MPEKRIDSYFMLIVVLAIANSFMTLSIDFFAPSMPNATRDLGVTASAVKNSIYLFLLGYGLSLLLWGVIVDRFGRRRMMLTGLSIYILATLGCYFSSGIYELYAMRVLQGIGAASGVIVARTTLRDLHGPLKTTKAISSMFLISVWVPIFSPLVGGYVALALSWKFSFILMAFVACLIFLGAYLWQPETTPVKSEQDSTKKNQMKLVLFNRVFASYAFSNMFNVAIIIFFVSNFSYLAEKHYHLLSSQNGKVLAIFNASISVGIYLVRAIAPRLGVRKTIYLGLWSGLTGWFLLWLACLNGTPTPWLIMAPLILGCIGIGITAALCAGEALVPFGHAAGTASGLFLFLQTAGATLISYIAVKSIDVSLSSMSTILLICSVLAILSMKIGASTKQQAKAV